jgi:hypothetical protein
MIYLQNWWRSWTLLRNMPELLCGQMKKVSLATGELQKAFPPICPAERQADRTPRGSLLAFMSANREPSNQSFEVDREATVCLANRRFFF